MSLNRTDVIDSLEQEGEKGRRRYDLLPLPVEDETIDDLQETWVAATLSAPQNLKDTPPAPFVSASKWRYGRRPAAAIPLQLRLEYRALTLQLDEFLPDDRPDDAYKRFTESTGERTVDGYILSADIANYYNSIPHELLRREAIERSGEPHVVARLFESLGRMGITGRGLPQGSDVSDRLGDAIAESIEHQMHRAGFETHRFADDFRIIAPTKSHCLQALDTLDEACQARGLSLSERKTSIDTLERYAERERRRAEALAEPWGELMDLDEAQLAVGLHAYDVMIINLKSPGEAHGSQLLESAESILERWNNLDYQDPGHERVPDSEVKRALHILTRNGAIASESTMGGLWANAPQLTPNAVKNIIASTNLDLAQQRIDALAALPYMTDWQAVWLTHAIAKTARVGGNTSNNARDWLAERTHADSELLAVYATWALACSGSLTVDTWRRVATRTSPHLQSTMSAALGKASGEPKANWSSRPCKEMFKWGSGA